MEQDPDRATARRGFASNSGASQAQIEKRGTSREHPRQTRAQGNRKTLASQTIKTMEGMESHLLQIGQKEFLNLLLEYPRISLAICSAFSKKLQQVNKLLLYNY